MSDEAASLLLVISHTTAGFPKEQAEELAAELLQVCCVMPGCGLGVSWVWLAGRGVSCCGWVGACLRPVYC